MGRIIGLQTVTEVRDFYDYDHKRWFRLNVTAERWLHSTKGWRASKIYRSEEPISFGKTSGPFVTITFKRC